MPLSRFPFRRTLFALAVTALFAPTLQAADKGRWINDGFGRSTRDGKGSSCVSSGGDTHAFANADCEGGEASTKRAPAAGATAPASSGSAGAAASGAAAPAAGAPAVIIVEDPKAAAPAATAAGTGATVPPAATIRDTSGAPVRDGLARKCVLDARGIGLSGADCDGASAVAEPMPAPAPAAAAPEAASAAPAPATNASAAAPSSAASSGAAATGTAAAAAVGQGAAVAALAGDDDDAPPEDDDADAAMLEDDGAEEDADEDTPWLADGDGPDAVADADAAPAYAGESLWGESAASEPPASAATARESDTAPVVAAAAPAEAPASAPPAAPPAVQPPLKRVLQVEKSALFDTNSAVLKQKSVPELDELAALLRDAPGYGPVTVVGHTDRLGSDKLNQRLSERRAKAVRDYLVTRGVDPARITSEGRGRMQPVTAPGACDRLKRKALRACLAPDRRVEIEAQDIQVPATSAK